MNFAAHPRWKESTAELCVRLSDYTTRHCVDG